MADLPTWFSLLLSRCGLLKENVISTSPILSPVAWELPRGFHQGWNRRLKPGPGLALPEAKSYYLPEPKDSRGP